MSRGPGVLGMPHSFLGDVFRRGEEIWLSAMILDRHVSLQMRVHDDSVPMQ